MPVRFFAFCAQSIIVSIRSSGFDSIEAGFKQMAPICVLTPVKSAVAVPFAKQMEIHVDQTQTNQLILPAESGTCLSVL